MTFGFLGPIRVFKCIVSYSVWIDSTFVTSTCGRCGEWKTKECGVSGMVCSMRIQYSVIAPIFIKVYKENNLNKLT